MPPRFKLLPPRKAGIHFNGELYVDYFLTNRPPDMMIDEDNFDFYSDMYLLTNGKNRVRKEAVFNRMIRDRKMSSTEAELTIDRLIRTQNSPFVIQRVYQSPELGYEFFSFSPEREQELTDSAEKQEISYRKAQAKKGNL